MSFRCLEALAFSKLLGGGKKGVERNRTTQYSTDWKVTKNHPPATRNHLFCFMWEDVFSGSFVFAIFNLILMWFSDKNVLNDMMEM